MAFKKRGQISTEYLIIAGFVIFLVISLLGVAFFYTGSITDRIKVDQINSYATKIISSAENVYYAGEPSRINVNLYLPSGVSSIEISEDKKQIILTFSTSSGENILSFQSKVSMSSTSGFSVHEGAKKLKIEAEEDHVKITDPLMEP